MATDASFLAAIAAHPRDHLPKLVYADWLDEQGDPRAEYLRLQYAMTQAAPTSEEWWGFHLRRTELEAELDGPWRDAVSVGFEWFRTIRDKGDVIRRLTEVAEEGHPSAMTLLAIHAWKGAGEKHDYPAALRWLRRGVEAGYAPAMYILGLFNRHAMGMWWEHPKRAADLFRRASDLGFAPAAMELAKLYAAGYGVRQNTPEAVRLYRLAAEGGDAEANFILGNRYREGRGVPHDPAEAVKHYQRAAELGDEKAAECLAVLRLKHPDSAGRPD